mgnify:CR=1 FL=1
MHGDILNKTATIVLMILILEITACNTVGTIPQAFYGVNAAENIAQLLMSAMK